MDAFWPHPDFNVAIGRSGHKQAVQRLDSSADRWADALMRCQGV
jgi:hypothetical protein